MRTQKIADLMRGKVVRRRSWVLRGQDDIHIARDGNGVPRITASSQADALRGLGHCHGRDRALQMVLVRIVARGRISECLTSSEETLFFDRLFRRLNLGADVSDEVGKLSPEHLHLAQAYCDGVNEAFAARRPLELRLVSHRPEPWTVADCLLTSRVVGYVGLAQSQGDMERLLVEMVQGGLDRRLLDELFPGLLGALDVDLVRRVAVGDRLIPPRLRWGSIVPTAAASNCWAIGPAKTGRDCALLAADPHLEVNRLPALWYEAVLEWGERFCLGATMPGLPAVILGRTRDLAWGVTYSCMDAHDSWIEECRDGKYRREENGRERWSSFSRRTEVIKRKRKPNVTVHFFENGHGILDGDPNEDGFYLTSKWASASGTGAASFASVFRLMQADDVSVAMEDLGRVETSWNWVLADRRGNIGYQMSGLMPKRRAGWNGLVPVPGWDPDNDWDGFVAPEDLPHAVNPRSGILVNANDDVNHLGRVSPINLPMGPDRAMRIGEVLSVRDDWDVASTQALQMDLYSHHAKRFMDILGPLLPDSPRARRLKVWDCKYGVASEDAYLFERFYARLVEDVFGRMCGEDVMHFLARETGVVAGFYDNFDRVLLDPRSAWFGSEERDAVFTRLIAGVLSEPVKRWGDHQRFTMRHILLGGRLPSWLGFDRGPIPLAGTRATVHQGQIFGASGRQVAVGPSYRLVVDLEDVAAHTALPGGPSDRRLSRWYASGVADWVAGRLKVVRPAGPPSSGMPGAASSTGGGRHR